MWHRQRPEPNVLGYLPEVQTAQGRMDAKLARERAVYDHLHAEERSLERAIRQ